MPYIATKPVRFDRDYCIGELIPDAVVDAGRAEAIRAMGLISGYVAPQEEQKPQEDQKPRDDQKPQEEPQVSEDKPSPKRGKKAAN